MHSLYSKGKTLVDEGALCTISWTKHHGRVPGDTPTHGRINHAPLHHLFLPTNGRLDTDPIGPINMGGEYQHILVVVDCFTRFVWLTPVKEVTGIEAPDAPWQHANRHGIPIVVTYSTIDRCTTSPTHLVPNK